MRGTFLQELVQAVDAAIAAFDRALLRMLNIMPLDEEVEDEAGIDKTVNEVKL